jgi:hypothetical protein
LADDARGPRFGGDETPEEGLHSAHALSGAQQVQKLPRVEVAPACPGPLLEGFAAPDGTKRIASGRTPYGSAPIGTLERPNSTGSYPAAQAA